MKLKSAIEKVVVRSSLGRLAALLVMAFVGTTAVQGATFYWDGTSASWNTAANWSTASGVTTPDPAAVPGVLDDAILNISSANGAQAITLDANQVAKSITINNAGTTTLTGGGTARTVTLGTGGITIASGAGAVTLGDGTAGNNVLVSLASGAQTWTHNSSAAFTITNTAASFSTRAKGSTLNFIKGSTGNFAISATVAPLVNSLVGNWAFLGTGASMTHATISSGNIAAATYTTQVFSGTVNNNTVNYTTSDTTSRGFSGDKTANVLLYTGSPASTQTYDYNTTTVNTYTLNGILAVGASGTLVFQNGGTSGTSGSRMVIGTANELIIAGRQNVTFNSIGIQGTSTQSLTYSGTGTLRLGAGSESTYGGGTTVNSGTLELGGINALGSNSGANNGQLTMNGGSVTMENNQSIGNLVGVAVTIIRVSDAATANRTLTIGTGDAGGGTFAGTIANGASYALILIKTGSGTITLSGANTYTGATTINGGTLNLTGNRTVALGNTLDVSGSVTPVLNISGDLNAGAAQIRIGNAVGAGGTINQTAGKVSFTGGTQLTVGTLGGDGIYNLSGGELVTANSSNRGIMIGASVNANGTFSLSGTGYLNMTAGGILDIIRSDTQANTGNTATFNQTGGSAVVNLRMGGGVNSTNTIANLNLSAGTFEALTFGALSGGFGSTSTINISGMAEVTLPAFPANGIGSGSIAVITFDGGTLKNSTASTNYLGVITSAYIKAGGATFDTTGGDITITHALQEDTGSTGGGLTKTNLNTLTLSGSNTYTGATTINGGILKLGATNVLAKTSQIIIGDGTLDAATFTNRLATLNVTTANAIIHLEIGGTLEFADSHEIVWTVGGKLTITGVFVSGSSIRFANSSGLTTVQLAQILIPGYGPVSIDSNGYLVAMRGTLIQFM